MIEKKRKRLKFPSVHRKRITLEVLLYCVNVSSFTRLFAIIWRNTLHCGFSGSATVTALGLINQEILTSHYACGPCSVCLRRSTLRLRRRASSGLWVRSALALAGRRLPLSSLQSEPLRSAWTEAVSQPQSSRLHALMLSFPRITSTAVEWCLLVDALSLPGFTVNSSPG